MMLVVSAAVGCFGGGEDDLPDITVDLASVATGAFHGCARTPSGLPWCWGTNGSGQLGTNDLTDALQPVAVQGNVTLATLSAGFNHNCGLTSSGQGICWGANDRGQVGIDLATFAEALPAEVAGSITFVSISAGGAHSCGVDDAGAGFCWGSEDFGQLGNGVAARGDFEAGPVTVLADSLLTAVVTGANHSCALTASGNVLCWGAADDGQLGDGLLTQSPVPVLVTGGQAFVSLAAGGNHTCGLTAAGALYCWGSNEFGQIGDGGANRRIDSPVQIGASETWAQVSVGGGHTCAVTTDNRAFCWGGNDSGQLGDGTLDLRAVPTAVSTDLRFTTVAAGRSPATTATCGMATSGVVYCWGSGRFGQLGSGEQVLEQVTPVAVRGQIENN
jgi:alpha-tubulin suppressor-like RCC1 family protein